MSVDTPMHRYVVVTCHDDVEGVESVDIRAFGPEHALSRVRAAMSMRDLKLDQHTKPRYYSHAEPIPTDASDEEIDTIVTRVVAELNKED